MIFLQMRNFGSDAAPSWWGFGLRLLRKSVWWYALRKGAGLLVLVSALPERVPANFAGRQIPAKIRKLLKIEVLECS